MRVAIASVSGAPGVSTLVSAMALASTRPLLVAECPADGGVFAIRWAWPRQPGLVDLAVEGSDDADLWEHATPWMGSARLLAADPSAVTMRRALPVRFLASHIGTTDVPTLVDLGRLQPDEATMALLSQLEHLWLLLEPTVEHVTAAASWRPVLERSCDVLVLLTCEQRAGQYPAKEIAQTLQWPVMAEVVADRRGAAALRGGGVPPSWVLQKLPLLRQARELVGRLVPEEEVVEV